MLRARASDSAQGDGMVQDRPSIALSRIAERENGRGRAIKAALSEVTVRVVGDDGRATLT